MSRSRSPRCRSSNSSPTRASHDEAANYSFVLRGYVRHWLANVWSEFDRIKLTDLVGAGKVGARGAAKNNPGASRAIGWIGRRISPDIAPMACTPVFIICSAPPAGRQDADRAAAERIPAAEERHGRGLRHQPERAVAARLPADGHRDRRRHRYLRQDAADGPPDRQ